MIRFLRYPSTRVIRLSHRQFGHASRTFLGPVNSLKIGSPRFQSTSSEHKHNLIDPKENHTQAPTESEIIDKDEVLTQSEQPFSAVSSGDVKNPDLEVDAKTSQEIEIENSYSIKGAEEPEELEEVDYQETEIENSYSIKGAEEPEELEEVDYREAWVLEKFWRRELLTVKEYLRPKQALEELPKLLGSIEHKLGFVVVYAKSKYTTKVYVGDTEIGVATTKVAEKSANQAAYNAIQGHLSNLKPEVWLPLLEERLDLGDEEMVKKLKEIAKIKSYVKRYSNVKHPWSHNRPQISMSSDDEDIENAFVSYWKRTYKNAEYHFTPTNAKSAFKELVPEDAQIRYDTFDGDGFMKTRLFVDDTLVGYATEYRKPIPKIAEARAVSNALTENKELLLEDIWLPRALKNFEKSKKNGEIDPLIKKIQAQDRMRVLSRVDSRVPKINKWQEMQRAYDRYDVDFRTTFELKRVWESDYPQAKALANNNPKLALFRLFQNDDDIRYEDVSETEETKTVKCFIFDQEVATGTGSDITSAEEAAARFAIMDKDLFDKSWLPGMLKVLKKREEVVKNRSTIPKIIRKWRKVSRKRNEKINKPIAIPKEADRLRINSVKSRVSQKFGIVE